MATAHTTSVTQVVSDEIIPAEPELKSICALAYAGRSFATAAIGPGSAPMGKIMPPKTRSNKNTPFDAPITTSDFSLPAMISPMPANAALDKIIAKMNATAFPEGRQPSSNPTLPSKTTWISSTIATDVILAAISAPRESGVVPRRFSTPYDRSTPVEIPRDTMPVAIIAIAIVPGTKKYTLLVTPCGSGRTFRSEKTTKKNKGMPNVTRRDSDCVMVSLISALACALYGLFGNVVVSLALRNWIVDCFDSWSILVIRFGSDFQKNFFKCGFAGIEL